MTTGPTLTKATPGSLECAEIAGARRDRRCYPAILHGSRDFDAGMHEVPSVRFFW